MDFCFATYKKIKGTLEIAFLVSKCFSFIPENQPIGTLNKKNNENEIGFKKLFLRRF